METCVDGFHLLIHPNVASSFETAALRPPQDEVLDPYGEERGNAARLEPRGQGIRGHDSTQAECILAPTRRRRVAHVSPRPPVTRVLRHVAVPGLLADVLFFVVAMAP